MNIIKAIWNLLNGNKTNIGTWITVIVLLLSKFGYGDLSNDVQNIGDYLQRPEVMAALTGFCTMVIGILHKLIKLLNKDK